jgi:chromosomal replication initiation ATPase DnaA
MDGDEPAKDIGFMTAGITAMQLTSIEARLTTLERLLSSTSRLEAIQEAICENHPRSQYLAVVDAACELFSGIRMVNRAQVMKQGRSYHIVSVRQAAMTILHIELGQTTTDVGKFFGKDHGTVLHAVRATKNREDTDSNFKARMDKLRALVNANNANNS